MALEAKESSNELDNKFLLKAGIVETPKQASLRKGGTRRKKTDKQKKDVSRVFNRSSAESGETRENS